MLADCYEYSLPDVADKMFLAVNTVRLTEKKAIEKFKAALAERGLSVKDLLED